MGMTGKCLRCSGDEFADMSEDSELFATLRFNRRRQTIDIDKAWHGIHFLLTGSPDPGAYPLDFLLAGGADVGSRDDGFGPPRAFSPDEVKEIWNSLEPITEEVLREQFSAQALADNRIYPEGAWDTSSDSDFTDYLAPNFRELRSFLESARSENQAVIVYLT